MKIHLLLLTTILISSFVLRAHADPGEYLTLDQAIEQVKRHDNGRVLSATTREVQNQLSTHNIRVLTPHGKVKRYQINKYTGQYINPKRQNTPETFQENKKRNKKRNRP